MADKDLRHLLKSCNAIKDYENDEFLEPALAPTPVKYGFKIITQGKYHSCSLCFKSYSSYEDAQNCLNQCTIRRMQNVKIREWVFNFHKKYSCPHCGKIFPNIEDASLCKEHCLEKLMFSFETDVVIALGGKIRIRNQNKTNIKKPPKNTKKEVIIPEKPKTQFKAIDSFLENVINFEEDPNEGLELPDEFNDFKDEGDLFSFADDPFASNEFGDDSSNSSEIENSADSNLESTPNISNINQTNLKQNKDLLTEDSLGVEGNGQNFESGTLNPLDVASTTKIVDPNLKRKAKMKPFSRDNAAYVCTVCRAKYFTKKDVEDCFESHPFEGD